MDAECFDALTRGLPPGTSRRRLFAVLATGVATAFSLLLAGDGVASKKRHGKHKKKKKSPPPVTVPPSSPPSSPPPPPTTLCKPNCRHDACGDDGCGGSCGTCAGGKTCQDGACACPPRQIFVDGSCVACDVCPSGCLYESTQAAITGTSAGGVIRICPGTYPTNASIQKPLTLIGAGDGAEGTILNGRGRGTVVSIFEATVTLRGMTIMGGVGGIAGGIINSGNQFSTVGALTLEDVHVTDNVALGNGGGGVVSLGTSILRRCRVTNNFSADRGGGLWNDRTCTMTLDACTVAANTADSGGGIINFGTLSLINGSIVTDNATTGGPAGQGGGINNQSGGTVTLSVGSSVTGNTPNNCEGTAACGV